jgi:para-aminobenzoate synthetase
MAAIRALKAQLQRPIVVALDGGSGAGKSTLARMLALDLDTAWIPLDDFFAAHIPDAKWDKKPIRQRSQDVFDWQRVREEALKPLLAGRAARWQPFDFEAGLHPDGTYGVCEESATRAPAGVILLDGAYSAGPQLADLVDLAVLVDTPLKQRHTRLSVRENPAFLEQWHARWDAVEEDYFTRVRPRVSFDLVVSLD